ncbi:UbiD family decarboxylase [Paenibacillus marchantiophytorum]|uniref:UbiD family decarboxylase n=1 Tax=Paenibacillus marchantiophytorum TaxID=1619310 RepID=UPI00166E50E4|nr:UbiD family decarboxylase [Paenibacillus marchantiophytorum]
MVSTNLRVFLDVLRRENELIEISVPVDPNLELAEIHRRVIDEQGPALLFTNVKGSSFPVVTNLFGTKRRVELAFGTKPEQFMKAVINATNTLLPPTPQALWGERSLLFDLLKVGTKKLQPNQAPILGGFKRDHPLAGLPVLTSWQEDGGPFVTMPLVYTEHPDGRHHHLGMYRMQVYDDSTTGMHWPVHRGGGAHYHEAEQREKPLPATVFLGGPPALIAAAIAPVPELLPKLMLASLILGQKLPMVENPHGGHRLAAEAEFAICGVVPAHTRRAEGPFGDHLGYDSRVHDLPIFHVNHVWHRRDAIYPATIVGKPRQEDYFLGDFLQRLLGPVFPLALPGVQSLWTYAETGYHPLTAAVVRESYSREALGTAFRILGEGQLSLTKFLIITDQPVELANFKQLLESVLERFDPAQDLLIFNQTSQGALDYTDDQLNRGSKAVLLGTGVPVRELPRAYTAGELPEIQDIAVYCGGCLVVSGASYAAEPELPQRLLANAASRLTDWPLIILVDEASAIVNDQTKFLGTVFTCFNPASDMYAASQVNRHHIAYELPIVMDARRKPGHPAELFPREDIVGLVERRWKEYFA